MKQVGKMGAKGRAFRHRIMPCTVLEEYRSRARGGSRCCLAGLESSRLGWVCSGEGLLVLPHQQLLLIRHHLKLIRCSFAGSCVLRAKEALQSERCCVPLTHGRMALLVCR